MAARLEETITATDFKARCLELMDRLARRELDRVLVTKRGRVVSVLAPPPEPEIAGFDAIIGKLSGSTGLSADHGWEAAGDDDLSTRLDEKFKQLL
jgi:antitoxin (DNA-binding transcriptional repressor) of toxin-antitoxin stability system